MVHKPNAVKKSTVLTRTPVKNVSKNAKKRILIITLGTSGTSAHLFSELARFLSQDHECRNISIDHSGPSLTRKVISMLSSNLRHVSDVVWAEIVIVHVPAALFLPLSVIARLLGRKLVIFQWDVYPITLSGRRYVTSVSRRFGHLLERACLTLADVIVLPSEDFRATARARDPIIFPLWPQSSLLLEPVRAVAVPDGLFHVAFAGQINELRGLRECVAHLRERSQDRIMLHVFSSDPVGVDLDDAGMLQITHHGQVSREELQTRLRQMHFGLISLSPRLDQAGFPSKTFDYLAAGLPILYFGRPLPAFTADLERCGVGTDISNLDRIDLGVIYRDVMSRLEDGRAEYLACNSLSRERLAPLL